MLVRDEHEVGLRKRAVVYWRRAASLGANRKKGVAEDGRSTGQIAQAKPGLAEPPQFEARPRHRLSSPLPLGEAGRSPGEGYLSGRGSLPGNEPSPRPSPR